HVLPGRWPVVTPLGDEPPSFPRARASAPAVRTGSRRTDGADAGAGASAGTAASPSSADIDIDVPAAPRGISERYALIVNYHSCHPAGGFLDGTNAITPAELDAQLRVLRQNFVCTTMRELLEPASRLPEAVAV